jgi:DNA-binding NtrC family response regulator
MQLDWPRSDPGRSNADSIPATAVSTGSHFRSKAYLDAFNRLCRFARAGGVTILIEGESGTGKTLHAGCIHELSHRAKGPFQVAVASTISDTLAESELFGHVAGAFTDARHSRPGLFASSNGGTLFLDEIGKASSRLQRLLLQVVEYGDIKPVGSDRTIRVDTRVIAASNIPLRDLVDEGEFLPDLHARLAMFRVELPPLRARREDIPLLVDACLDRHAPSCGYDRPPEIDAELMNALETAEWPNNLRELDATIHRLMIDAEGMQTLTTDLCVGDLSHLRPRSKPRPGSLHRPDVEAAIVRAEGNVSKAARLLEIDRTTVHRILRREPPSPLGSS